MMGGKLVKFDTDKAELLLSTRWSAGRDQTCWLEIYRSSKGRYIAISCSVWQGKRDHTYEMEEGEVLYHLALAEASQRTPAGEELLAVADPSEEL